MTSEPYFALAERDEMAEDRATSAGSIGPSITLLDTFSVHMGEEHVPLSRGVERLIALVALSERPLRRTEAAATLWPESSEDRAAASLRTVLWRMPRTAATIVQATTTTIRLSSTVRVDVSRLRAAARDLKDVSTPLAETIDGIFTRDLLPGWYEDWVIVERDRLKLVRLQALEALGERYAAAGRLAQAEACFAAAVSIEPLRENAQRALVRTLIDAANPGEALLRYRAYRALLERELGVGPSDEMERLISHVLAHERAKR
jgi:DNA-binding SARP family transcriptional activator